jgi:ornithine carbamoyltransferase
MALKGKRLVKRDFLSLADLTLDKIAELLELAISLKKKWASGGNAPYLANKTLAMAFQKPSLRTRVSFDMAMAHLGGRAIYLAPEEIRLGERESVPDAARVLSRYVDAIMARVYSHADVVTLAKWASVPVINGLSDHNHPCQGLTDLLTIYEKLGTLRGIKLAYVGDGNNVLHSLLIGGAKTGMHVTAATPKGYAPSAQVVDQAISISETTGATIRLMTDPHEAVRKADVIYTDTWTSMGQEAEIEARLQAFPPYQINTALLEGASPDVGVMHCLPAHRGQEITDQVADGPHSWLFDQAENRLHAQKAILVDLFEG